MNEADVKRSPVSDQEARVLLTGFHPKKSDVSVRLNSFTGRGRTREPSECFISNDIR